MKVQVLSKPGVGPEVPPGWKARTAPSIQGLTEIQKDTRGARTPATTPGPTSAHPPSPILFPLHLA
jgi:hypothetical protein